MKSMIGVWMEDGTQRIQKNGKNLKTIGIKSGDEVILPAITYFYTASSISYQNAIPVFVDVNLNNVNIDTSKIEKAISKKTKEKIASQAYELSLLSQNMLSGSKMTDFIKRSIEIISK